VSNLLALHREPLPAHAAAQRNICGDSCTASIGNQSVSLASAEPNRCLSAETEADGNQKCQQEAACKGEDNRRDEDRYEPDGGCGERTRFLRTGHTSSDQGRGKNVLTAPAMQFASAP
jgi:hypothetical protein